jgi:hypothetical protein
MKKNQLNSLNLVSSSFIEFIEFVFIFQPYLFVNFYLYAIRQLSSRIPSVSKLYLPPIKIPSRSHKLLA